MTTPSTRDDDSWGDLYAELGLDKPAAPPAPKPAPERKPEPAEEEAYEEMLVETWSDEAPPNSGPSAEEADLEEGEDEGDGEEGESGAAGEEGGAEGAPGTGRKRRRRRRRRKKTGAGSAAPEAEENGGVAAEAPAEEAETVYARPAAPSRHDREEEVIPFEAEQEPFAAVNSIEETSSDTLRDLIRDWKVPSWDDIIGGLYRPER